MRRLFCSLAFATRLSTSPYRDLTWANVQREVTTLFKSVVASVFHLSCDSPLQLTLDVGAAAIPVRLGLAVHLSLLTLLQAHVKLHSALKLKPNANELTTRIPVEVELTREQRFHSVFTCPVSREQTVPVRYHYSRNQNFIHLRF